MLVKQSKSSFIRCTSKYGYITNQQTRQDRVYNATGALFLMHISRFPNEIDDIIKTLLKKLEGVSFEELKEDFISFINDLEDFRFVVTGFTEEELEKKDLDFNYANGSPKTLLRNFTQSTKELVPENTQDFFLEENQGKPLISAIQFELSSRCNERCIHCYVPNAKKNQGFDMPFQKVKNILDEFASMGGIHVTLSGGEAFLHKDLMNICKYCREKDLKITILSNLISLKDEHIPILRETNVSLIQTSLYSMDPIIHDKITTVKGSHQKTITAIEKLVAANIPVQLSCPLMKTNKDGYREVLEYAQKLKIRAQTDYILMAESNLDTSNLKNRLSLQETEKVIRDIIEYDIDYREISVTRKSQSEDYHIDKERFKKQPLCGVGYDNCCITANGDVYPCAGWQNYILGNVYHQSLKEIWEQSEKIIELRKITQANFPQCLECEAFDFCSRCLVRNYNETNGDMFSIPKHFCDVAFLNMRLVNEYEEKIKKEMYIS